MNGAWRGVRICRRCCRGMWHAGGKTTTCQRAIQLCRANHLPALRRASLSYAANATPKDQGCDLDQVEPQPRGVVPSALLKRSGVNGNARFLLGDTLNAHARQFVFLTLGCANQNSDQCL